MNRHLFAALLAALMTTSAGYTAAQETPDEDRGAARREQRAQRREKLRQLGEGILDQLGEALEADASSIDVNRVNDTLAELLAPLAEGERAISGVSLAIDPQRTQLNADQVAVAAEVSLRRSLWSERPTTLVMDLAAHVEDREDAPDAALVQGSLAIDTDVVALANFALPRIGDLLAMSGRGESDDASTAAAFRSALGEKLARTGRLANLDELADVLTYLGGLHMQVLNEDIERLAARLRENVDETMRVELENALAQRRLERDRLFAVRTQIARDQYGAASEIRIEIAGAEPTRGATLERVEIVIRDHVASVAGDLSITTGVELYSLAKPIVVDTLRRLQERDEATLGIARGLLNAWFGRVRDAVVGREI